MKKKTLRRNHKTPIHKKIRKSLSLFWRKGAIAMYVLLFVVVVGAFFLAGGVPKFNFSPTDNNSAGEVDLNASNPTRESLQLNTLKFKTCASTAAVDFLVDTSGSMEKAQKMQNIQNALKSFATQFTGSSVTGIRRFSSNNNYSSSCPFHNATSRLTNIDLYANNKTSFLSSASSLCPDGGTNTRTAFQAELTDVAQAVTDPRFKDYNFNVVFISDGIPEDRSFDAGGDCQQYVNSNYPICAPYNNDSVPICRCFANNQDPTINPSVAQQLKDLKNQNGKNVRVFSILVFDPSTDGAYQSRLTTMMTDIASSPTDFHQTTDPTQISAIYSQISSQICSK